MSDVREADPARNRRRRAALGSILFLVVAPGTVAGLGPWLITRWHPAPLTAAVWMRPLGIAILVAGGALLLETFTRFAMQGLGTPAPVYPTERLVIGGSYRFVRNPMYVAVLLLIAGQVALFGSLGLLIYCALVWLAFHLFVLGYEEPTMRRMFPESYRAYGAGVRRWLPRITPWTPER